MDTFEVNKNIAVILLIFVVKFEITKISDYDYYVEKPAQSAYKVEFLKYISYPASPEKPD